MIIATFIFDGIAIAAASYALILTARTRRRIRESERKP